MIGIIDYNAGNLTSVQAAFRSIGAEFRVVRNPDELGGFDRIVVPGVGEARAAMEYLNRTGMGDAIREFARTGKPFLGICLGSQIILDRSEERDTPCLGIIPGLCRSFLATYRERAIPERSFKIPHIGWNRVDGIPEDGPGRRLFDGIGGGKSFYFDHGYYNDPVDPGAVYGVSDHGIEFPAVIGKDNVTAAQFHPEKSGVYGLRMLANFADL